MNSEFSEAQKIRLSPLFCSLSIAQYIIADNLLDYASTFAYAHGKACRLTN